MGNHLTLAQSTPGVSVRIRVARLEANQPAVEHGRRKKDPTIGTMLVAESRGVLHLVCSLWLRQLHRNQVRRQI